MDRYERQFERSLKFGRDDGNPKEKTSLYLRGSYSCLSEIEKVT